MLTEADDNVDRRLDFKEFVAIVTELKTGALRSAEPFFTDEEAPAEFLTIAQAGASDIVESRAAISCPEPFLLFVVAASSTLLAALIPCVAP